MNLVATWLVGATALFAVALLVHAILARRRPLAAGALWNAVLVAALAMPAATWWLPRWELPLLPAEQPPTRLADNSERVPVPAAQETVAVPAPRTIPRPEPGPREMSWPAHEATSLDRPPATHRTHWLFSAWVTLAVVYSSGLVVLLFRLTASLRAVRRLHRQSEAVRSALWRGRFDHWRRRVACRGTVDLLQSCEVQVPLALGWRRPAIVIPAQLLDESERKTIDAILVHELAHVARADCGWQLIERVVRAGYWFHPLVWLAGARIAAVRERACDDFAIHALADRESYAETLLAMAARLARRQQASGRERLGLAMAVVRTTKLEQRLTAIAKSTGSPRHGWRWAPRVALLVGVVCVAVLGVSVRLIAAHAAGEPKAPAPAPEEKQPEPRRDTPASEASREDDIDFVRDAFPRQQKELVTRFHDLLRTGAFAEAEELLAPALRSELPAAELKELVETLASQFSPLETRLVLASKRAGTQELLEVQSSWGRHRVRTTFHFDEANRIDGLWFSLDPRYRQFAPELTHVKLQGKSYDLTADELVLGEQLRQLTTANKSLTVRFVANNGDAADGRQTTFYRALGPEEAARSTDWRDATGLTWRSIVNESRIPNRAERLTPGTYRAMLGWSEPFGHQLGDPIVIDPSQQDVQVDVPIRPTATVTVNAVDAATDQPLAVCDVRLVAEDPRIPPYRIGGNYEKGVATITGLIPGRHRLTVQGSAQRLGESDYPPREQLIDVAAGENPPVAVRMQGQEIAPADRERRWPYVARGRITDDEGRPIAGAEIAALIARGFEREYGRTTSDADGNYQLRFGVGYEPAAHVELPATIQITKPRYYDRDFLARKPLILLGQDRLPAGANQEVRYLMPGQTLELDFVLVPGVDLRAEFVDAAGKPIAGEAMSLLARLPEGLRHATGGKTSPTGELLAGGISPRESYVWARIGGGVFPARSRPFRFSAPGTYRMRIQSQQPENTEGGQLAILEVLNEAGADVTAEVVGDDPLLRDPLSAELQTACRQIVDKLLAANRLWLTSPPESLRYQFEIVFDEIGKNRRMSFDFPAGPATNRGARHGVSFESPLMALARHENVVYRAMEVTPGRTVLAYTFKKPVRLMVGNGVDDFWRGSIQTASREGVLVIDTTRDVPLELQGDMLIERYDDYRALGSGQMVPLRISISSSDSWIWRDTQMSFDWEFEVVEPDLWMFSRARNPQAPDGPPIMTLEKLLIDGKPGRRLDKNP